MKANTNQGGTMIKLDTNTRAGRMLEAGRLTLTFRSVDTGQHITVTAKCRKPRDNGQGWESCRESEAKVIFLQVPNAGGGWDDRIGKITASKGIVFDGKTDQARRFCAQMLLRYAAGEPMPSKLEVFESDNCGRCGRQLTDPVSIERGIGPECYGMMTGSQHQVKHEDKPNYDKPFENDHAVPPKYPTEGARVYAETGKSQRQLVIEEAFPGDERLQSIASQEATYIGNVAVAGGRPSDAARSAVHWVRRSLESRNASDLSSPIAVQMMQDFLHKVEFSEREREQEAAAFRSKSYLDGGRMSRRSKAQALVDSGLADDLADARAQLEDMGE